MSDKLGNDDQLKELIDLFGPIGQRALGHVEELVHLYPRCDRHRDARMTGLYKLVTVVNHAVMGMNLARKSLNSLEWWRENMSDGVSRAEAVSHNKNYNTCLQVSISQLGFSVLESTLRLVLNALDPGACGGRAVGHAQFKSVFECLLKNRLAHPRPQHVEFIELYRCVRNTIHNNGVYFDKNGEDRLITWQSETYEFIHKDALEFVDWNLLVRVFEGIHAVLIDVSKDKRVVALQDDIVDPFVTSPIAVRARSIYGDEETA